MKQEVLKALDRVIDPEVGFSILELGLIYDIQLFENRVKIVMSLSTKSCPMHEMLLMWVKNELEKIIQNVEIELVFEPAWNIQMASKKVKMAL